jgi:hypothetical protein
LFKIAGAHEQLRRPENVGVEHITRVSSTPDVLNGPWKSLHDANYLLARLLDDGVRLIKRTKKLNAMRKIRGVERDRLRRNVIFREQFGEKCDEILRASVA